MSIQIYQYILLTAFICSLLIRKQNTIPYFVHFLGLAVFFELVLGKFLKWYLHTNIVSANIYVIISIVYFLFVFTREFRRSWHLPLLVTYLISLFISLFYQGLFSIMTISYNTGMLLVIFSIFMYLYDLIYKRDYRPLDRIPLSWMALGVLAFYSSLFPLFVFINRFMAIDLTFTIRLMELLSIGNIFLSFGYLGALLCQMNIRKLSTSSP